MEKYNLKTTRVVKDLLSVLGDNEKFFKKYFKYIFQSPSLVQKQLTKTDIPVLQDIDLWIENITKSLTIYGNILSKENVEELQLMLQIPFPS